MILLKVYQNRNEKIISKSFFMRPYNFIYIKKSMIFLKINNFIQIFYLVKHLFMHLCLEKNIIYLKSNKLNFYIKL